MSRDLNRCEFIGRLGKDPTVRYTPAGVAVVNFSIACSDDYKDKQTGETVEQTEWVNIFAFNRLAEVCGEYLHKGKQVYVAGKYVTRKWQDNQGNDRWSTEVHARDLQLLGSKSDGGAKAESQAQYAPQQGMPPDDNPPASAYDDFDDDDIPF